MIIPTLYLIMLKVPKNFNTKFQLIMFIIEGIMEISVTLNFLKKNLTDDVCS